MSDEKRAYQHEYYLKNKERLQAYKREYSNDPVNREVAREAARKRYLENKVPFIKKTLEERRHANTAKCKKYRETPNGKIAIRRAILKYEQNHPERKQAWIKAQYIKPGSCGECGVSPSHKHHPDPHKPLEIVYLCPPHYKNAHLQMKK